MVLFVTALMVEAAPIINYFNLKKDINVRAFTVYKNTDIALIVSGVGKLKSAAATAYICSICGTGKKDLLVNVGFCGAYGSNYAAGTLLSINKITDMDSNKDYYPDIFYNQNIPKAGLCCYSRVIRKEDARVIKNEDASQRDNEAPFYCDMESAGFMETAIKFVYTHNIVVLKIISDYLEPENLDQEHLRDFVGKQMPQVESIIHGLKELNNSIGEFSFAEEEKESFTVLFKNLRFSEAMKQKFLKVMKILKLKEMEPVHFLRPFMKIKAGSRSEGKMLLEQIITRCKEGSNKSNV
jgi:adenosylhomocysteine nucleosidase